MPTTGRPPRACSTGTRPTSCRSTSRGTVAELAEVRERFPGPAHLVRASRPASRTCSRPASPPTCATAPVDRVLGSLHSLAVDGRLVGVEPAALRPTPDAHDAALPRRARAHDRGQRRVPGPRARATSRAATGPAARDRYAEKDFEEEYRAVFRALARHRPRPGGQHDQPAGVGGPGALVPRGGRRGGELLRRSMQRTAGSGRSSISPSTSSRRRASGRGATGSTSGAADPHQVGRTGAAPRRTRRGRPPGAPSAPCPSGGHRRFRPTAARSPAGSRPTTRRRPGHGR